MAIDEPPVQPIPDLAPGPPAKVAHLENVVRSADVGLGCENSTIAHLTHAIDIGAHHPVVGVEVTLHKPPVNLLGLNFTQQHQVADHHQALNVVVIAQAIRPLDGLIQGRQARGAVLPAASEAAVMVPKVGLALAFPVA